MVKDSSHDDKVTKKTFDKSLNELINSNSIKLSLPTESNKRNKQNHIEDHFNVENCFKNLKYVTTDEFESLKKSFLKEVIIFKNEILQSSIAKTPQNYLEGLIDHLESQILFLQRELKEKDWLVNSLLKQLSKCNDIIKTNEELSKNNVKLFENKTSIKQHRFIEITTTTNKESK